MTKSTGSSATVPADRTLTTTRVFDAPREVVFKAWTDQKQFARWFPPDGFSADCELDVRPGGSLRVDMKGEDPALGPDFFGKVFPGKGVYKDVVPNERLAFTFEAETEKGEPPVTMVMTVIFEDQGRKAKLTIHQTADTVAGYEELVKIGATEGLRQSLDKLTVLLEGKAPDTAVEVKGRTLTLTRVFDAPRDLVWTAYTDPAHIVKWMFAKDWETPSAEVDLRAGGAVRIRMRPADHSEEGFVFEGKYREIARPERIVLDISDGRVMTTTFEPAGDKTKLTLSVEMAESEENERTGYSQILENFAKHLATLKRS
ncbi:MAG TPA: SRPBCC domain-containing protein [Gemmatimonadaceae bacterium]|nr:SRPBCC domain-containing protein [Gemmatimonadaceae bacterium]